MLKLYKNFHILHFQKRIVSAENYSLKYGMYYVFDCSLGHYLVYTGTLFLSSTCLTLNDEGFLVS